MSLVLNDASLNPGNLVDGPMEDERDIARLDRYLAIIEDNKRSCHFVPNDALMALDMAGFVRGQLANAPVGKLSAARLALALAQPCSKAPVQ